MKDSLGISTRRRALKLLGAASTLLLVTNSYAAELQNGSGTLVVPFPPGGPADTLARILADGYGRILKRTFVVDNRPGATGNIGATQVARAAPTGLTLLVTNTALVMNPFLFKRTNVVDPFKDLTPVSALGTTTFAFVVPGDAPENSLKQWAERIRRAGRGTYGSFGVGSANHLYAYDLAKKLGLNLDQVPYKGDAPALQDLLGGNIDSGFFAVGSVKPFVESGKLKALAVTGDTTNKLLPSVPTFESLGISDFGIGGWLGVFAPAATPLDVRVLLSKATVEILADPNARAKLSSFGLELYGSTPERLTEMMRSESVRQGARIKASGASLD